MGARLPSERELAQRYNVSRMTGRHALQALAQDGYTTAHVGRGTFVNGPKIDQELRALTSFSEDMKQRGLHPSSRVLRAEVRAADNSIANHLRISSGSKIIILSRARLAGNQFFALETTHIPHHLCPDLLDKYDFSQVSLYEVLRKDYNCTLVWADQIIETRLPEDHECKALELDRKQPVLSFTRVTFDDQDKPIEFVRSIYRGDQYQFRVVLRYSEHRLR